MHPYPPNQLLEHIRDVRQRCCHVQADCYSSTSSCCLHSSSLRGFSPSASVKRTTHQVAGSQLGRLTWPDDRFLPRLCHPPTHLPVARVPPIVIRRWQGVIGSVACQITNLSGCIPHDRPSYLEMGAWSRSFKIFQAVAFPVTTLLPLGRLVIQEALTAGLRFWHWRSWLTPASWRIRECRWRCQGTISLRN